MVTVVAQTEAVALVNEAFTTILESTSRYKVAKNGSLGLSDVKQNIRTRSLGLADPSAEPWIVPKKASTKPFMTRLPVLVAKSSSAKHICHKRFLKYLKILGYGGDCHTP